MIESADTYKHEEVISLPQIAVAGSSANLVLMIILFKAHLYAKEFSINTKKVQ